MTSWNASPRRTGASLRGSTPTTTPPTNYGYRRPSNQRGYIISTGWGVDFLSSATLQSFYRQVSSPLLRRIAIQFPDDTVSDVTQNRFDKYFSGSELVVAGKVLPTESNTLTSLITASAVSNGHL